MSNKDIHKNPPFAGKILEEILENDEYINIAGEKVESEIKDFERNMEKGARRTDHRFKL